MVYFYMYRRYMKRQKQAAVPGNDNIDLNETNQLLTQENKTLDHKLVEEIERLKKIIEEMQQQNRNQHLVSQTQEPSTCTVQQNIINLQEKIGEKEQQIEALKQNVRSLKGDKSKLDTELKCSEEKSERLENEVKNKNQKLSDVKDELTSKKVELGEVKTDLKHISERMNEYLTMWKNSEKVCEECRSKFEEYHQKWVDLDKQLTVANLHLDYLKKDYDSFSKKQGSKDDSSLGEHIFV